MKQEERILFIEEATKPKKDKLLARQKRADKIRSGLSTLFEILGILTILAMVKDDDITCKKIFECCFVMAIVLATKLGFDLDSILCDKELNDLEYKKELLKVKD